MADNVQGATFEILKRIGESSAELRTGMTDLRSDIGRQFESLAADARKDRRNINGLMALLQAASGDFNERIRDHRVSIVEDRAS